MREGHLMRHRRHHLLLVAAAAVAIGFAPAWSPMAIAGEAAAPDDTTTSSELTEPALSTAPSQAPGSEEPVGEDPAGVAAPTEPATPAVAPTDDVTDPLGEDTAEPEGPMPSGTETGQPAVSEKADEGEGHEGGGHGEGGTLPDGVTVTVDGRDITATDPEGSLPKIASCTFDVTASGLTVEPPDTVGVRIVAWPPTAPGESRVKLIDVTETSADGTWSGSFPLDEAVQQFDRKGNGYHMRFEFLLNGQLGAMKMYWLGCGEPQTGNPRRMLFDVQWYDAEGVLVTDPLNDVLPAGWRAQFVLRAAGDRGTAECSYPPGSDLLNCLYVNPGHGDDPGLVLPGKPGTAYTVDVVGVPGGWTVDTDTIGFFLADDTCPKGGGGGHEDGHDGDHPDSAARAEDEGQEGGHEPCLHTVVVNQAAVEPPPDEGDGGGATPPDNGGGGNAAPPTSDADALPLTGATSLPLLPVGLALVALGAVLVLGSRPVQVPVRT
jgi:hypothetical protein